jgi:hypothetical protein
VIQTGSSTLSGVDSTVGNSSSFGVQVNLGNFANGSYNNSSSSTQDAGSSMTVAYTNTATTSTSLATSAANTISDDGKTNQLPVLANYYFDNRFGTWMFQVDTPQTCYGANQNVQCVTPCQNTSCTVCSPGASGSTVCVPTPPCSLGASGATVCPAVGVIGQAAGATATCGASIVIRGWGLTGTNQVQFVPVAGNTAGNSGSATASVVTVVSDDIVNASVPNGLSGNYQVAVSGEGATNVVVGTLNIQSACP